tara:strand:+ start:56 stop:835 length:780 start_codon:yes stop_codon:yes gene_type:complete
MFGSDKPMGGARPGGGTTVGEGGMGPGKGPDNDKTGDAQIAEDVYGVSDYKLGNFATTPKKQLTPTKSGFGLGFLKNLKDFNFGDFFDKAYTGTGQFFGSTSVPIQAGLLGLNIANFNPQFDEFGNTIGTSRFGKLGTSVFGSYNPNNPAYGFTEAQKQSFMNSLYDPDETTKGYSVNELAAKEYADSIAPGVFDSLSLEKTAEEVAAGIGQDGNKPPVVQEFVNPVESKFTEEQLIAYNEYIERGYPPEIAEYLVTKA